ncbi:MAG: hypothetical protein KGJ78_02320 [Alphaproteobacteria bacterium]|nr:hypothetical protein [Alphaproteobacteria bacterium]
MATSTATADRSKLTTATAGERGKRTVPGIDGRNTAVRHGPAIPSIERPLVLTTIDAEESFDWSRPFTRDNHNLAALGQQHFAHHVFEKHNVVPIYLVTYPVVVHEHGYRPLLEYFAEGRCEIGTQLHPWVTPPFTEQVNLHNSFPGNLPAELECEKLRVLTDAIGERFGRRPIVYRAGRYGLGPATLRALRRLGYKIDTSVVPEQDYSKDHGPSFFGRPVWPYWADEEQTLLELPLTSAFVGLIGRSSHRLARALYLNDLHYGFARSVLVRANMLERIRLTPEGTRVEDAKKLVRVLLRRGIRIFVVSYHTPSLVAGNTPYVQSVDDRNRLLRWLDEFYEFFREEIGGRPATTAEIHETAERARPAAGV